MGFVYAFCIFFQRTSAMRLPRFLLTALVAGTSLITGSPAQAQAQAREDPVLTQVLAGDWRSAEQKARDPQRRPAEVLAFWGLRPGMSVLEVAPGGQAWWTEILAPYIARTGGHYAVTAPNIYSPTLSTRMLQARMAFELRYQNAARYGHISLVNWGPDAAPLLANSYDWVLLSRTFHNFMAQGLTSRYLHELYVALKSGGIVAVEQHRANPGNQDPKAPVGYVTEAYVIDALQNAGFKLEARSDLNANPKDRKDHPFGVWTLPPTRATSLPGSGQPPDPNFDHSKYDAIGESDRMTLKFVKP